MTRGDRTDAGRALVVGMSGATGLAVVRALSAAGCEVHALHDDAGAAAMATRLAACSVCPDWRVAPERFLDFVTAHARDWLAKSEAGATAPASLFVCDDSALDVIWRARGPLRDAGLRPAFSFVHPPAEVLDKREQARAARAAGVAAPFTEWGDAGELAARAGAFQYPLLLKPAVSHEGVAEIGAKALRCETPDDLRAAAERTRDLQMMVQDFVPGGDDELYTAAVLRAGGKALVFTGRKLKQHPPTLGIARLAEAVEVPEIVAGSVRLCRELGYEGVAQVEFKRDARDGVFRLMEVNFRPWTWSGLATACGVPLIVAAHEWALGGEAPPSAPAEDEAVLAQSSGRWIWLGPEAAHTARELAHGVRPDLSRWRHLKAEAFYARRDPAPFRRALAAPVERRLEGAKTLADRLARPPAFALNAVLLPLLARRQRVAAPATGLPPGDRLLVLAPHPDDETILCGATMAAARRRGDVVRVVAVTSGAATRVGVASRAGGGDAAGVAAAREAELRAACAELGVGDVVCLRFADGGLAAVGHDLATRLGRELDEFAPTDIVVPFPYDVHPDHVATTLALAAALATHGRAAAAGNGGGRPPVVHCGFVMTPASPGWITRVVPAGGDWGAKRRALAAHASRRPAIFAKALQLAWFNPGSLLRRSEAFVDLPAPGFAALAARLDAEGLTRPALRSPWHPLLTGYELARTEVERRHIGVALRAVLD